MSTHVLLYVERSSPQFVYVGTFEELLPIYEDLRRRIVGFRFTDPDPKMRNVVQAGDMAAHLLPLKDGFWGLYEVGKDTILSFAKESAP